MAKVKLPATTTTEGTGSVSVVPKSSVTVSEALALVGTELQQAIGEMNADDITLECSFSRGELNLRLRAYRHRPENHQ
jgi:hypothetical protein